MASTASFEKLSDLMKQQLGPINASSTEILFKVGAIEEHLKNLNVKLDSIELVLLQGATSTSVPASVSKVVTAPKPPSTTKAEPTISNAMIWIKKAMENDWADIRSKYPVRDSYEVALTPEDPKYWTTLGAAVWKHATQLEKEQLRLEFGAWKATMAAVTPLEAES